MAHTTDIIDPQAAGTLPGLFRERVRRSATACAYRRFNPEEGWREISWIEVRDLAARWQGGLQQEKLKPGDRVAVMLKNCLEWVLFDLASLGLGLVTVPLFANDRPQNFAFILEQTGARLLLIGGIEQWRRIEGVDARMSGIERIVSLQQTCEENSDPRLIELASWLPAQAGEYAVYPSAPGSLATIVYTSGTTGTPKGVMLSHANLLGNAFAGLQRIPVYPDDVFLSFLPLSHTLERTVGYYVPMMSGACVAHVRSIDKLPEDLLEVRPTVLNSVPRIYERVHKKIMAGLENRPLIRRVFFLAVNTGWKRFLHLQGRTGCTPQLMLWPLLKKYVADRVAKGFGGQLRVAISGGAPLAPPISRVFIGLGVNLLQGYGLTETSPVVSVNTPEDNLPSTVGKPLPGIEAAITPGGELLVRGPNVMLGYWRNDAAAAAVIDDGGWFHTGDLARIDADGHITITGRLKEIIVLSTGEKIPPEDLEIAITVNPLFEQAMVVGEGHPYLAALVTLNGAEWEKLAGELHLAPGERTLADQQVEEVLLTEIARRLVRFPGYAQVRRVHATLSPWNVEDGLITSTLKLRRRELLETYAQEVASLYAGH